MRILMHSPDLDVLGGKASYIKALMPYFKKEMTLFEYGSRGKKESKFSKLFRLLKDYFAFYREVRNNDYDLIHINPSLNKKSFFRDSIFVWIAEVLLRVPVFVQWHGWEIDFESKVNSRFQWLIKTTYFSVQTMGVLAPEFKESLEKWGYRGEVKLETTFIDDDFFDFFEKKIKKQESQINLLFLSRVEPYKGIFELLEAYKGIRNIFPTVQLSIAGTGSALEEAKKFVHESNWSEVKFLGFIQGNDKIKAFSENDLYIFPSYGEGFPISLLEAMAARMVLITTTPGGIKTFFNKSMGKKIKEVTSEEIEKKVIESIRNISEWSEIGEYNHAYCKENFTPEKISLRIRKYYKELIKNV